MFYSQEEDGVVSLALPSRNSLTFNRFVINPTFSFVREQNKYFSISNKREWVQFDDNPETYLVTFGGRLRENVGGGVSLFTQKYGVLTTFGGTGNFAYNVRLGRESNLTFGTNLSLYKSGVDGDRLTTNIADPSFDDIPSNFLFSLNPGINFGMAFIDIGVSLNNLVLYNFTNSTMIDDNPEKGIQAHFMYTGYIRSRGFFDESKFSGLIKSEFKQDNTVVSGIAMLTVPKGIWAQVGYNTQYGISGGLGLSITKHIAIEYNFEKALGDLTDFGPSHEISLAFRFDNTEKFDYNGDEDVEGLIKTKNDKDITKISREQAKINKKLAKEAKEKVKEEAEEKALAEQKAKEEAEAQAKALAEQKAKEEAEAQAKALAEQKAKEEAEAQAKALAEQKAKEEAEAQAKALAEQKAKEEAEAQAKALAEQKAKEEAEAQAKALAEQKAKEEAEAQAKALAEQKAKEEAEAQAKALAEQKAKEEAEAQAKALAEQKAKEEAEAQAKALAEQKTKEEAEAQAKALAEQKAKEEAEAQANERITNPKDDVGKSMYNLTQQTEEAKTNQNELLKQFDDIVEIKNQDLKDLKEENDLSEQGIAVQPKAFKSVTAENNKLNAIKSDLDEVIKTRNEKIKRLKSLYDDKYETDTIYNDEVYLFYRKTIERLESEQLEAQEIKTDLETRLEEIKVATEFERRRRIKRAAFDNEDERYTQDRAALQRIKETTALTNQPLTSEDFDFGEEQSDNIQILKNVRNVDKGYYLIIAVHSDVNKRNDFVTKVVASGRSDVDFFYDVNTSKYYIYYDKFDNITQANQALETKGNRPYNTKMSIVKIE